MKKLTALFLGLILMLNFVALAGVALAETQDVAAEAVDETAETAEGKTLVVYFSATGNTEAAANYIAEATGADILALEPSGILYRRRPGLDR